MCTDPSPENLRNGCAHECRLGSVSKVSWSCVGACTGSWEVWESVSLKCLSRVVHLKQTGHQHDSFIAQLLMVWSASSHLESSTLYSRQRGPVPLRKRPLAGRGVDRVVPTSVTVVVQLAARCKKCRCQSRALLSRGPLYLFISFTWGFYFQCPTFFVPSIETISRMGVLASFDILTAHLNTSQVPLCALFA